MPLVQHTMRHSPTCFPRQIHSAVSQSPTIWIHPFPYPFPYPFPFHPLSTNQLETNPQPILSRSIHDSAIWILHFNSFGDKRLHPNFHSACRVKDMYAIRFYNQINGCLKAFHLKDATGSSWRSSWWCVGIKVKVFAIKFLHCCYHQWSQSFQRVRHVKGF